ncbi:MAG: LysR family transcriptional regulator [Pseudomonadota bacterium]
MRWDPVLFDWNQARAFLATAEEGSLSAAARALGQTQPTLSRQVAALEDDLGVMLFERAGRSLSLTKAGLELLDHFRSMRDAANRISLTASGQSQAIEGEVRVTATNVAATRYLPAMLKRLRQMAPAIRIDIITSNEVRDLTRREADIAIRHARPTQPDLIARLVGETTAHLYASTGYLEEIGNPKTLADLSEADFIGFDQPERLVQVLTGLGVPFSPDKCKLITASGTVMYELVRHGLGISILAKDTAEEMPGVEQVLPDLAPIPVPVWLVTHRELHTSRRIRLVFDLLAEEFSRLMRHPASPAG